jgi:DNA-binding winged helix-turn-helix (wHTH) protein
MKVGSDPRAVYSFGPFALDPASRRLTRNGEPVAIPDRHVDILLELLAHPGQIVSKDRLIEAAWKDVAVTDNSLEQAISVLRRALDQSAGESRYIETLARRGYRFSAPVARTAPRYSAEALDAMLAPHRAFIEGRAASKRLAAMQSSGHGWYSRMCSARRPITRRRTSVLRMRWRFTSKRRDPRARPTLTRSPRQSTTHTRRAASILRRARHGRSSA